MVPRPLESLEMNETVEFKKNIKPRDKCFVIDANVGFKWFSSDKEDRVDLARKIQFKLTNFEIEVIIPDLFLYEILNSLLLKKNFCIDDLIYIKQTINLMHINVVFPDEKIFIYAIEIAVNLGLTYYDAIYIAVAEKNDAVLITEDKKILSHASDYNFIKSLDFINQI